MLKNIFKRLIIFLIIIVICIFAAIFILKTYIYPRTHFDIVKEEASNNNVDPYLVLAIIKTESGFDSLATSNKNAKGLMQIMESTAEDINNNLHLIDDLNETNIYDPEVNIAFGCKYLSYLINHYQGNYYLAICAYNAGMGNVDKWIEDEIIDYNLNISKDVNIPFSQTKNYLEKVINSYNMYRLLY